MTSIPCATQYRRAFPALSPSSPSPIKPEQRVPPCTKKTKVGTSRSSLLGWLVRYPDTAGLEAPGLQQWNYQLRDWPIESRKNSPLYSILVSPIWNTRTQGRRNNNHDDDNDKSARKRSQKYALMIESGIIRQKWVCKGCVSRGVHVVCEFSHSSTPM